MLEVDTAGQPLDVSRRSVSPKRGATRHANDSCRSRVARFSTPHDFVSDALLPSALLQQHHNCAIRYLLLPFRVTTILRRNGRPPCAWPKEARGVADASRSSNLNAPSCKQDEAESYRRSSIKIDEMPFDMSTATGKGLQLRHSQHLPSDKASAVASS